MVKKKHVFINFDRKNRKKLYSFMERSIFATTKIMDIKLNEKNDTVSNNHLKKFLYANYR